MSTFKTVTVDDKLIQDIKAHIGQKNRPALTKLIDDIRPSDMVELIEHLDPDERLCIFELLEPKDV